MYGHRMCLLFSKKLNHLRYHAISIFKPRVLFIFKITHIGGIVMMKNRTRPVRVEFRVTEQEHQLIQKKMEQLGTKNMGAYLRKMAIDGYIIKVDFTEQKKLAAAVSRVAGNINQICRRINQTGHFYEDDIVELKAKQCEIWELLKQSQKAEL